MSTEEPDPQESELPDRTVKAATEKMLVEKDGPDLAVLRRDGTGDKTRYKVFQNGMGCTCKDNEYRKPAGGCKHERRARMVTDRDMKIPSEDELPEGSSYDPWLLIQRQNYARGEAISVGSADDLKSDGGVVAHPGKVEDEDTCNCHECDCQYFEDGSLPCWQCYNGGIKEVNHS